MGVHLAHKGSVFGGGSGFQEEGEGEIVGGEGAELEGLEEGEGAVGEVGGLGEDSNGGVEGEKGGAGEDGERARGEARREAPDEASGDKGVVVGAEAQGAGEDRGDVARGGEGAVEVEEEEGEGLWVSRISTGIIWGISCWEIIGGIAARE